MNYGIKKYTHITKSDREAIKSYLEINLSIRKIPNILHKNPSTISREIVQLCKENNIKLKEVNE